MNLSKLGYIVGSLWIDTDTGKQYMCTDNTADTAVWSPSGSPEFVSTDQVITSAGALTLAHSLGAIPKHVEYYLVCQTAEFNYSIGDILQLSALESLTGNNFMSITVDATNLNVRYGSGATVFRSLNKTTGAKVSLVNVNWKVRFIAQA